MKSLKRELKQFETSYVLISFVLWWETLIEENTPSLASRLGINKFWIQNAEFIFLLCYILKMYEPKSHRQGSVWNDQGPQKEQHPALLRLSNSFYGIRTRRGISGQLICPRFWFSLQGFWIFLTEKRNRQDKFCADIFKCECKELLKTIGGGGNIATKLR